MCVYFSSHFEINNIRSCCSQCGFAPTHSPHLASSSSREEKKSYHLPSSADTILAACRWIEFPIASANKVVSKQVAPRRGALSECRIDVITLAKGKRRNVANSLRASRRRHLARRLQTCVLQNYFRRTFGSRTVRRNER